MIIMDRRMRDEVSSDVGVEVLETPRGSLVTMQCPDARVYCDEESAVGNRGEIRWETRGAAEIQSEEDEQESTPISSFRRKGVQCDSFSDGFPRTPVPMMPDLPEDGEVGTDAGIDSPSWNVRMNHEIAAATKAYSVASDPTGMDERIHTMLQGALSATRTFEEQNDQPRSSADVLELANVDLKPRFTSLSQDRDDENTEKDPVVPDSPERVTATKLAVSKNLHMPFSEEEVDTGRSDDRKGVGEAFSKEAFSKRDDRWESSHIRDAIDREREGGSPQGCEADPNPSFSISSSRPQRTEGDEKKEDPVSRKARFSSQLRNRLEKEELRMVRSLSMTESDVGSVDGLPSAVRSQWLQDDSLRENILKSLDGIQNPLTGKIHDEKETEPVSQVPVQPKAEEESSVFGWPFNLFWTRENNAEENNEGHRSSLWNDEHDDAFALMGCADIIHHRQERPAVATSLIRVTCEPPPPSYAETLRHAEVDPRMQDWIDRQFLVRNRPPSDGNYYLGTSRTVIVHEIQRGDWTWCTAWSPDGRLLALATENHHLAVVDTSSSTVWRVQHDQKISGPVRNNTTHSIRSIAWGRDFIAIGGTGSAVSLLQPTSPYSIVHRIPNTGFVGALDWRPDSSILAIASRLEKTLIVRVETSQDALGKKQVTSQVLHSIRSSNWVNTVAFSPGGRCLAVGDAGGKISVYNYTEIPDKSVYVDQIKSFTADDSILDMEWSPDGKFLYAGGEDFRISIIETSYWEIIHQQDRQRWVQCIASSKGGTHMAVGGVSSEISILDVKCGWESTMGIELKGLVPLSATWHPNDQYLALTGQSSSVLIVETTNARHVSGHHLQSVSPVLAIEFSPDGRMAVIGNESGIVTFFSLSASTFETAYEIVITTADRISTTWSANGQFVVVGSKDALTIVGRGPTTYAHIQQTPPRTSGFSIRKVLREFGEVNAVSVDSQSHYIAVCGSKTWILDSTANFSAVLEWKNGICLANGWSPDGRWLATIGMKKMLTIYQTGDSRLSRWRPIFRLECNAVGRALAWGPIIVSGLLYLAFGGDDNEITIMEIRAFEGTWETVLRIPRDGPINALDWNSDGLLAAAIGNGTVSIIDLSYLQSGVAVNEMDYNWQRQALTCFTEIRRNRGKNSMRSVRWIPSAPGSDSLLAVGGTDGEVEILDMTERRRCRGYVRNAG